MTGFPDLVLKNPLSEKKRDVAAKGRGSKKKFCTEKIFIINSAIFHKKKKIDGDFKFFICWLFSAIIDI